MKRGHCVARLLQAVHLVAEEAPPPEGVDVKESVATSLERERVRRRRFDACDDLRLLQTVLLGDQVEEGGVVRRQGIVKPEALAARPLPPPTPLSPPLLFPPAPPQPPSDRPATRASKENRPRATTPVSASTSARPRGGGEEQRAAIEGTWSPPALHPRRGAVGHLLFPHHQEAADATAVVVVVVVVVGW